MYERTYGSKYDTELTTTQIAAKIRGAFRKAKAAGELAECTVSIRTAYYSMGSSITCRITGATFDILTDAGARYELAACEGNFGERPEVYYTDEHNAVVEWFEAALGSYNHDGSDSSIDYYDVNFSGSIECGWELMKSDAELVAGAFDDDPRKVGDVAWLAGDNPRRLTGENRSEESEAAKRDAALDSICGVGTAEVMHAIDEVRRVVSGDDVVERSGSWATGLDGDRAAARERLAAARDDGEVCDICQGTGQVDGLAVGTQWIRCPACRAAAPDAPMSAEEFRGYLSS